jgi:hypothetical protein
MSQGVFGVDRGVWDHPLFQERKSFSRMQAWLWLLSEAAWKPRRVRFAGQTIAIHRGQIAHSIRFMAKAWRWEQTKVVRFLSDLKTETMIATETATGITVTTICNYDKYQIVGLPYATSDATENATETQQDRNTSATNKKKGIKEEDNDGGGRPNAFEIATELAAICGHPTPIDWPPGWCGSPHWVQKCLNEGWFPDVMIAETRAVVGRKRDGPIDHFKYLEKPLARAHAQHQAPLPKVEIPKQEVINGSFQTTGNRGGSALDAIRQVRRGLGSEPDRDGPRRIPEG